MGTVAVGIDRIARSRVRDALLHLTRDGPSKLRVETIANEAAVEPVVVEQVLDDLRDEGPFEIEHLQDDTSRWWVV